MFSYEGRLNQSQSRIRSAAFCHLRLPKTIGNLLLLSGVARFVGAQFGLHRIVVVPMQGVDHILRLVGINSEFEPREPGIAMFAIDFCPSQDVFTEDDFARHKNAFGLHAILVNVDLVEIELAPFLPLKFWGFHVDAVM